MYSLCECERGRDAAGIVKANLPFRALSSVCGSGVDRQLSHRGGTSNAVRVPVCVRVVIDWHACEPLNHTISAQMPLGEEQPASSGNKLQMVQMT
ncbi:Hypothetical predicted protein [Scomber scombrus]|uniref:Uncharacterized protein n=1 Tax=Scomber scombrus TaxID=13677 RepID=A0AAV1MTW7_SCOSC